MRKPVEQMTRYEILDALAEDHCDMNPADAAEVATTIQRAARAGCLLWTRTRVVSTLATRPLTLRLRKGEDPE